MITHFWEARLINGMAPKELAPNLFLIARSKHRTVHKELHNLNWIRNLKDIKSTALMEEFILLFMALTGVELSDQQDFITWKWTEDSHYFLASAYECQFKGAIVHFPTMSIWQATTEPKCKFYAC
jgi:hypothetical protein